MEVASLSPVEPLDIGSIRSRIRELREIRLTSIDDEASKSRSSDADTLLRDCVSELESKVKRIVLEYSDVASLSDDDLGSFAEHLKEELHTVETENVKICCEIEGLMKKMVEESDQLESHLGGLSYSLDLISSQGLERGNMAASVNLDRCGVSQLTSRDAHEDSKFKILELEDQIEEKKAILKSLQDLDCTFKWLDSIERIEQELCGLKVIEFDGKCIRLSLQTYIPKCEGFVHQMNDGVTECSKLDHELLIEVSDGTLEMQSIKIFPNDIHIDDIVDAAKSYRESRSQLVLADRRSSLEWFVRKVQERIILCTIRRFLVKSANKSRHSFEYLEREEMIVAHIVGVDAFMKVPTGWPVYNSTLKLLSLKSTDQHSKGISLGFFCRVEEAVNSLDVHVRQNLSSFVDALEKILLEQMRLEVHSDPTPMI